MRGCPRSPLHRGRLRLHDRNPGPLRRRTDLLWHNRHAWWTRVPAKRKPSATLHAPVRAARATAGCKATATRGWSAARMESRFLAARERVSPRRTVPRRPAPVRDATATVACSAHAIPDWSAARAAWRFPVGPGRVSPRTSAHLRRAPARAAIAPAGLQGNCDAGLVCCQNGQEVPGGAGTCTASCAPPPCTGEGCACNGGVEGACDDGLICCLTDPADAGRSGQLPVGRRLWTAALHRQRRRVRCDPATRTIAARAAAPGIAMRPASATTRRRLPARARVAPAPPEPRRLATKDSSAVSPPTTPVARESARRTADLKTRWGSARPRGMGPRPLLCPRGSLTARRTE